MAGAHFAQPNDRYLQKHQRVVEDIDGREAARLETPAEQHWSLEYDDLLSAIDTLSPDMRRALMLVGLGMTHMEAADIMKIPLGTLKSHVRRGRAKLYGASSKAT